MREAVIIVGIAVIAVITIQGVVAVIAIVDTIPIGAIIIVAWTAGTIVRRGRARSGVGLRVQKLRWEDTGGEGVAYAGEGFELGKSGFKDKHAVVQRLDVTVLSSSNQELSKRRIYQGLDISRTTEPQITASVPVPTMT
jgi:hypothetical protein